MIGHLLNEIQLLDAIVQLCTCLMQVPVAKGLKPGCNPIAQARARQSTTQGAELLQGWGTAPKIPCPVIANSCQWTLLRASHGIWVTVTAGNLQAAWLCLEVSEAVGRKFSPAGCPQQCCVLSPLQVSQPQHLHASTSQGSRHAKLTLQTQSSYSILLMWQESAASGSTHRQNEHLQKRF